jgi:5'-nucleotidase
MRRHARLIQFALVLTACLLASISTAQPPARTARASAAADSTPFTILLSNDDGYGAPGLVAMAEAMRTLGEVYVAAPATNQSGKGHSITTSYDPIFVAERKQPDGRIWWSVEAPPATCVRVAVETLLPRKPDVVISGVNPGDNLGVSVFLSGTVGAAREAALVGIPSIAVSMEGNRAEDFAAAATYARALVEQLRARNLLRPGLFLNVNTPSHPKGTVLTRQSTAPSKDSFERRQSPRGRIYYWSKYQPYGQEEAGEEGTDVWAFTRGYVAITPMLLDTSAVRGFEALRFLEAKAATAGK